MRNKIGSHIYAWLLSLLHVWVDFFMVAFPFFTVITTVIATKQMLLCTLILEC